MVDLLWLHLFAGSQAQLEAQIAARKAAREAEERAEREEDERAERRAAAERQKMEEDFQRQREQQLQIQQLRSPPHQQPPQHQHHHQPPPLSEGGSEIRTSSPIGSVAGAPPHNNGDMGANAFGSAVERVMHPRRPVHELPRTPDVSVLFRAERLLKLF